MSRRAGVFAFAIGLAALGYVAWGYGGVNPLALAMTLLIAACYGYGALELHRFQQATDTLHGALAALPAESAAAPATDPAAAPPRLADWLARLHPSLRHAVRLRVEGERAGLPGPALTPYLVGLLVLLGMLGTFLGMVVTLKGAVLALESTTDLPAMRAALAAPVKGLGLAFGTSVAGVAASAMLGLMSALCRRDRLQAAMRLDSAIAGPLHGFSQANQRAQTLATLQQQARLLPALVDQVQGLMAQLARQGEDLNQRLLAGQHSFQGDALARHADLNQRLLAGQQAFHGDALARHAELASAVDRSLQQALAETARNAAAAMQPVVAATLDGMAREAALLQQRSADTVAQQLGALAGRFEAAVGGVGAAWAEALAQQQRGSAELAVRWQDAVAALAARHEAQAAALRESVEAAHVTLCVDAAAADQQRLAAWTQSLAASADALQAAWQRAGAQAQAQQAQICTTLEQTARAIHAQAEAHARHTVAEVGRLVDTASEAPRAAAELVAGLRQQLSDSLVRDNGQLAERGRIMAQLATLLDSVNGAADEQRAAVDALVEASASALQQLGSRFDSQVEAGSAQLADAATQVAAGAVEVASLGESVGAAVQQFSDASQSLAGQLQRIEAALSKSSARSDEQLAYYVAQAREIIDLSISAQQQIVEDLRQIAARPAPQASEPA